MNTWGLAMLCAGGLGLVVATAARAVGGRPNLSEEERKGASRLSRALYGAGGVLLVVGLVLSSLR